MFITKFYQRNYRNLLCSEFLPCGGVNVILGDNAQGKTNLLEALWLFTGERSFRGAKEGELPAFGRSDTSIALTYRDRERAHKITMTLGRNRKLHRNFVKLHSFSQLAGSFLAVVFTCNDLALVKEGKSVRREFLDQSVAAVKPLYRRYAEQYARVVSHRNALLKTMRDLDRLRESAAVWDVQLAQLGTALTLMRRDYVDKLGVLAAQIYDEISGGRERLAFNYQSTVFGCADIGREYSSERAAVYISLLGAELERDAAQGFTARGPHRDELDITVDGKLARDFASGGQQRSVALAVKLAQARMIQLTTGEFPVILLDDVMSELDISRQRYILQNLKRHQVFITCCDEVHTNGLEDGKVFQMHAGALTNA